MSIELFKTRKRRISRNGWLPRLRDLRGQIGCYALYEGERCQYVGKADCLYTRLRNHANKMSFDGVEIYRLGEILKGLSYEETKLSLGFFEALVILRLDPAHNIKRKPVTPEYLQKLPEQVWRHFIGVLPVLEYNQ